MLILVSSLCVDIRVIPTSVILLAVWDPMNQTVEVYNSVLSRPKQMLQYLAFLSLNKLINPPDEPKFPFHSQIPHNMIMILHPPVVV